LSCLIKLEALSKAYRLGNNNTQVLHNIHLEINKGELTAIVGASGSGKSTLMHILGLLDRCTKGKYFFLGKDVSNLADQELAMMRNTQIGFVFQSFFLLPRLTALQNVMLPLFYRGANRKETQAKALTILEKIGVAHLSHHKPSQLSGGQQQRIAIARALIGNPEVILADEPTGALDSKTSHDVMNLFVELNQQEGRTIIIITHAKEISERCVRSVTIKDGTIIN
jgi:putative ABC transport system ATP-binding protein